MEGWIKLHRQILDWEWYQNLNVRVLFLHLLIKANHAEKKWCGKTIKAGQLITSIEHLSAETGLTQRQVRTAIEKLKNTGEIDKQTTSQNTLIIIKNWNAYQENDKQMTNERQTNDKQMTTNKNEKNVRNKEVVVMEKTTTTKFVPPTIQEVLDYCRERNNGIDAERFWHYYNSKGWKIGKEPMKKWKSAVITWEKQDAKSTANSTDNHIQEAIKRMRERNNG